MAHWMGIEVPTWLLVIIAIAIVLWTSQRHGTPGATAAARRGAGKSLEASEELAPASDAAQDVAMHLGLGVGTGVGRAERRLPVTIIVNDVVLRRGRSGAWSSIPDAVRVVLLLNEIASVFLVAKVDSDEEERHIRDLALLTGLVAVPSDAGGIRKGRIIPEHRLLFCSSETGQLAFARQLRVSLHIGGSLEFLQGLSRFVPSLIRIASDAADPADAADAAALESIAIDDKMPLSLPRRTGQELQGYGRGHGRGVSSNGLDEDRIVWREFKSLVSAAGLCRPSGSSSTTTQEAWRIGNRTWTG